VLARQLQHALDSRVLIEQAKGAVAARLSVTPDAAFQLLRAHARRSSQPLTEIAAHVIGGELPAHVIVAVPETRRRQALAKQRSRQPG
jgi:AmiR/NasT family two-component response regulator